MVVKREELKNREMEEAFGRDGVAIVPSVFDAGMVEQMQAWTLELPLLPHVQVVFEKGHITRCEHFVHLHAGMAAVAGRCADLCGRLFAQPASLFKEKLNYKPPGGAGFLPHLDHPSLAFYTSDDMDFVTAMVAIDDMTPENGCLRVVRGDWTRRSAVACVPPEGDPEVGGRAGAISEAALADLVFTDVACRAGTVVFFNGFVPHRSGPNLTGAGRRAVFFTFNPASQGDHRVRYYQCLADVRDRWRRKLCAEAELDYSNDLKALASVPSTFDRSRYAPTARPAAPSSVSSSSDAEHEIDVDALF